MIKDNRFAARAILVSIVPLIGFTTTFFFLRDAWRMTDASYAKYREFWGGAPSEVFSHWLDMVLMSGNAISIAWLTSAEAFFGSRNRLDQKLRRFLKGAAVASVVVTGIVGVLSDWSHGEGAVLLVHVIFFTPVLASSNYILRRLAALLSWKPLSVIGLSATYAIANVIAQLFYEPSSSGAPNILFVPLWLISVGTAIGWVSIAKARRSNRLLPQSARIER